MGQEQSKLGLDWEKSAQRAQQSSCDCLTCNVPQHQLADMHLLPALPNSFCPTVLVSPQPLLALLAPWPAWSIIWQIPSLCSLPVLFRPQFPLPPLLSCSLNAHVPWVSVLGPSWVISPRPVASASSGMLIICSSAFQPSYLPTSKLQLPSRELHLNVQLAWHPTRPFSEWVSQKMPHVRGSGVRVSLHVADCGWHQGHNCWP